MGLTTSSLFTRPSASGTGFTPTIMQTCGEGQEGEGQRGRGLGEEEEEGVEEGVGDGQACARGRAAEQTAVGWGACVCVCVCVVGGAAPWRETWARLTKLLQGVGSLQRQRGPQGCVLTCASDSP